MRKRNPHYYQRKILRALLIESRKNLNIKQTELAKKIGKPQSFVSKYENGERNLDLIEVRQICIILKIYLPDFIELFEKKCVIKELDYKL